MSEPVPVMQEIEKLLTQVFVVALTLAAGSLTRRGVYYHVYRNDEVVAGGFALALIWALTILFARWRQGPSAWWLLVSAPIVLAMPVTRMLGWLFA
jgi:hypothetical protein